MASVQEIFTDTLPSQLVSNPDRTSNINAIYQFNLTGDDGGNWTVDFTKNPGEVSEGEVDGANCTVTMSAGDFADMWDGKLNPAQAFMMGKIKIDGDMGLAMKLQNIIGG